MKNMNNRSYFDLGVMSPQPTVVIVIAEQQIALIYKSTFDCQGLLRSKLSSQEASPCDCTNRPSLCQKHAKRWHRYIILTSKRTRLVADEYLSSIQKYSRFFSTSLLSLIIFKRNSNLSKSIPRGLMKSKQPRQIISFSRCSQRQILTTLILSYSSSPVKFKICVYDLITMKTCFMLTFDVIACVHGDHHVHEINDQTQLIQQGVLL